MAENKCIGCDTLIPYGSNKCPMCGAPVSAVLNQPVIATFPQHNYQQNHQSQSTYESNINQKTCKYCSMRIPSGAKICPYCRKQLSTSLLVKIIAGFFLFFAISGWMQAGKTKPSQATAPAQNASTNIASGAPIEILTGKAKIIQNQHPGWSNDVCKAVAKESIHIGMTAEQVEAAWGKPYKINSSVGSYGRHEQWVMSESISSSYVYFENGIMTSLQQSN